MALGLVFSNYFSFHLSVFYLLPVLCNLKQLTLNKTDGHRSKYNIKTYTTEMGCGGMKGFIWLRR
jgi:hypothetical protein